MSSFLKMNRRQALSSGALGVAAAAGGVLMPIGGARAASATGYVGLPRTFLWNPGFNALVDTAKFKKPGPYTIGFSNASQADLWLVTFFHGVQWAAEKNAAKLKKFIVTDANSDPTKQVSDIQDLIQRVLCGRAARRVGLARCATTLKPD